MTPTIPATLFGDDMPYDKNSFLAGVAAGRNMKSIPWLESESYGIFSLTIQVSSDTTLSYDVYYYFKGHIWWGDGTEEDALDYAVANHEHTYSSDGIYTITMVGTGWDYRPTSNKKLCLLSINTPLLPIPTNPPYPIYPYDTRNIFQGYSNLKKLPDAMFKNLTKAGISYGPPTQMFADCTSLEEIPKRLFEGAIGSTRDASRICSGCTSLKSIPDDLFENETYFSTTENAYFAFENCSSLESIPGNLTRNLVGVKSFQGMFKGCTSLKAVPSGLFVGLENVQTVESVFSRCSSIEIVADDCFVDCAATYRYAFEWCSSIISNVPPLWERYPTANGRQCFIGCVNAANYNSIPSSWR